MGEGENESGEPICSAIWLQREAPLGGRKFSVSRRRFSSRGCRTDPCERKIGAEEVWVVEEEGIRFFGEEERERSEIAPDCPPAVQP